jgi:ADP-heptose:LPS heptosyltransferase
MAMGQQRPRILVYQLGSIGDTVVSIPALKAVRRHYGSNAEIILLHEIRRGIKITPADLLTGSPEIDRFIGYSFAATAWGKMLSAVRVLWRLRHERFQAVVYLMPSERTAVQVKRDLRFFRCCGIAQYIGFQAFPHEFLYSVGTGGHPSRVKHEALCRLERLSLDGIDVSKEEDLSLPFLKIPQRDLDETQQWLKIRRQKPGKAILAICPGTKQPANSWPTERFIEIGKRLAEKGKYELMVVGGLLEAQTGDRMVKAWREGLNAAGKFSVLRSMSLLHQCAFCIGLDTGTTHLAAAMGTLCVALYGERDNPGRFEPLGEGHIILRNEVPCAGCRLVETQCTVEGHPCMMGISVEVVWNAILQMEANLVKNNLLKKL